MTQTNKLLSGIEINQNSSSESTLVSVGETVYQEFYLPANMMRGSSDNELRIPQLTGFSVLLGIDEDIKDTLAINWTIEREVIGTGWVEIDSGISIGAQAEGEKIWFDVWFNDLLEIDIDLLEDKFRFSFSSGEDVDVWHSVVFEYLSAHIDAVSLEQTLTFRLFTASGDRGVDFLGNTYRNAIFRHGVENAVSDGVPNAYWLSKPNPSRFAIESLYFDVSTTGVESVIDSILIDPITPDVYFHIYYSSEGEPVTEASEWDEKLWHRVPKTFQARTRTTHILPEPISTRYVKIEFSHLQAKPYMPGIFQQPIKYLKHPKWVLDYFLARIAEQESINNRFIASNVEVRYNALDLAYNYYLDDLRQELSPPTQLNPEAINVLNDFFQNRTDRSDEIDAETLSQINTIMQPYRAGTTGLVGYTLDGENTIQAFELPIEREIISTVSSLNRDAIILEQDYPVMFYYLTCRHRYREVSATLPHDRAYFVGIRQIAFLREQYTNQTDTSLYIEIGGDSINLASSDFVRNNNSLVIS